LMAWMTDVLPDPSPPSNVIKIPLLIRFTPQ
jgi:hypothetical protein